MSCNGGCAERARMILQARKELAEGKPVEAVKTVADTARHFVANPPKITIGFKTGSIKDGD